MSRVQSWTSPRAPTLPGNGVPPLIRDTSSGELIQPVPGDHAHMYVCGITPYDSTHLGHASTYIAFDTLVRAWRDTGLQVRYVQNITDIDDPLLERANQTGVDWFDLARQEVELYTSDMAALRVIPPEHFIGVVETVDRVAAAVADLLERGAAYQIDPPDADAQGRDTYADMSADGLAGTVGHLDEDTMDRYFAERGGDPEVSGKKHRRDALLWRSARPGEPAFDGGPLGPGRPGWHIECSVIAHKYLDVPFHLQGGGTDLIYPHHEMSTSHLRMMTDVDHPAVAFMHTGLVAYQGEKMSKSRGNLVFVSDLLAQGAAPAAVRLSALANHYSVDWEYSESVLHTAQERWERWRAAFAAAQDNTGADRADEAGSGRAVLEAIREALHHDLDTPAAVAAVDEWAAAPAGTAAEADLVADAVDALLGVDMR